jgi:hypothetical protein
MMSIRTTTYTDFGDFCPSRKDMGQNSNMHSNANDSAPRVRFCGA